MGTFEDLTVLHQIGLGFNDIDSIVSVVYPLGKSNVQLIVNQFSRAGLVVKTEKELCLSKKGLLELSRQLVNLETHRSEYFFWSIDGLPFFEYESKLHKDIITHPDLLFEPASPYVDDEKQLVYETSLPEIDFEMENAEIIYNLLFETEYLHPTGFWLFKSEKKKLCGWGIDNLAKTLTLVKKPCSLLFLCAFQNFIVVVNSELDETFQGKMAIKVYISKAVFPYVDTLDFLANELKTFLVFNKIQEMPKGREIQIETSSEWKELPESRPKFTPKLIGKILHRTADRRIDLFPYVFAVTLPPKLSNFGAVSPWFITCPGGCLDEEFRCLHYVHFFQIVSLPEIDVATLMISNA